MLSKIEALRKKPKHVRSRYAFWIAFSITLVILLLWAITLPARFAPESTETAAEEQGSMDAFAESFGSVFNKAAETFRLLQASSTADVPAQAPQQLDFEALIASSTEEQATTTAPALASTTASTTGASSTASTTRQSE